MGRRIREGADAREGRRLGYDCPPMLEPDLNGPEAKAAMAHVKALLGFIGDDPSREGLVDTPARVVKAMHEHFWGYHADPFEPLQRTFGEVEGYD